MGALPNYQPKPENPRKPVGKAKKAKEAERCPPRTLPQIEAEYRARTNYDRGTGYFPMFHALWVDIMRLSCGLSCTNILVMIFRDLAMRSAAPNALPVQADFSVAGLALEAQCDERQVNRVLEYLQNREMATVGRLEGGRFVIALRFRQWGSIAKSYQEWDAERRAAEAENPAEEAVDDTAPLEVKEGTVRLTKAPVQIAAGQKSKPIKVNTGVRTLRIHWESKVLDLQFEAVVMSGELILTGNVPDESFAKSTQDANREESTRSRHSSGHGRPNGSKIPASGGMANHPQSRESKTTTVEHARAKELAELFDPLIFAHCKQTLSGDPKFHAQACEAIGDTPHDDLVKAAVDRGARMLRPGHVPQVCKEIRHNWEAGKTMPAASNRKLTREEMDALVAADREARLQREATARRKKVS